MTILLQCDKCWLRFATKHKKCPKCGNKITVLRRRYCIEVRGADGKKHVKSIGNVTPEEARIKEAEYKRDMREVAPATQTIRMVCMSYVQKLKSMNRVYTDDVDHRLSEVCAYFGASTDVQDIDIQKVDAFRGTLLKKGLARATVDRYFAAGRAAWNYSVNGVNPWKKAGLLNPDNKITRYLSEGERDRLLVACSQVSRQLFEIVFVALGTGLRKSEVLSLRREQVDFEKGSLSVLAKGDKRRLLYPSQSVMEMLRNIPNNDSDYFWLNGKGQPHNKFWKYPWTKALKIAGLPVNLRFHDLRHDSATRAYSASGDIYLVQQILGHSNITTTMRYAHLEKEKLQRAFNTIDPNSTSIANIAKKDK